MYAEHVYHVHSSKDLFLCRQKFHHFISSAPSGVPMNVTLTDLTPTSVSFQWGSVECIRRNGQITGYFITYNIQGSSESTSVLVTVNSLSDGGTYTIIDLEPSEMYSVQIAAQNTIGTALDTSGFAILTHGRYTD